MDKERAAELSDTCGYPPFLALLLVTRGMRTKEEIDAFLWQGDLWNPLCYRDMETAVERIARALDEDEKIAVYGDYDADGVTATALLFSYLEARGADAIHYIPLRDEEGYGMTRQGVDKLAALGVGLIITVDNGVAAADEIAYAASLGMETVVTDHHQPPAQLPEAVAVVDPHRADCPSPFKELCGVGVAFALVCALEGPDCDRELLLENFSDLIAIGTIGDMVSLTGENRALVKRGLAAMEHTSRLGLKKLMEAAGVSGSLSAGDVAYKLVPRINAMGRLGNSERALRLFLTDYEEEAQSLAAEMNEENKTRQRLEGEVLAAAAALFDQEPKLLLDRVLVVWGSGWHPGVLGIVAARLTERYGKPCIVLTCEGEEARGSARSLPGFPLPHLLSHCGGLLSKYGGHALAAGMSLPVKNLEAFRREANRFAREQGPMPMPVLRIDCRLNPARADWNTLEQVEGLEPFGAGNPAPVFGLYQMRLDEVTPVGGGKHLRLVLSRDGVRITAMRFGVTAEEFGCLPGDLLDLAVTLDRSEYRGQVSASILVRDYKPAGCENGQLLEQKAWYEAFAREEALPPEVRRAMLPTREETGAVYRYLKSVPSVERWNLFLLCGRLKQPAIGYHKLIISLLSMAEVGLLSLRLRGEEAEVRLLPVQGKTNLEQSPTLRRLRQSQELCG